MAIFNIVLFVSILAGYQWSQATARALTPSESASTCYKGSPMIYSDACFGQEYSQQYPPVFPGIERSQVNSSNQLTELYALLNMLQGSDVAGRQSQPPYSMGGILDGNIAGPQIWESTNPHGSNGQMVFPNWGISK